MAHLSKFAALTLIALLAAAITACGGNGASEPATTTAPATATPAPTPRPTDTIAPTATPRPTNTPEPTASPESTATPRPTATPNPTATAMPDPTATPRPTNTPNPTATPRPTAMPEPTTTPRPLREPIANALAPLGDNLQWAAHYDNATGQISVYDPTGSFSLDALSLPPGLSIDDSAALPTLTHLATGQIYFVSLIQAQQVVLGNEIRNLSPGVNFLTW